MNLVEAMGGGKIVHLRSSLSHQKFARIFSFFYQASRECIRSSQLFFPRKQIRSCYTGKGIEMNGSERACLFFLV